MAPLPKDDTKRRRILDAALQVFAEEGLNRGKIATIARRAGIGKGTVYEYFRSKEEIFEVIFQDFFRQMFAGYQELFRAKIDARRKLELVFDYTFDLLTAMVRDRNKKEWMIFFELIAQGLRDEFRGSGRFSLVEIMRELYGAFDPLIAEGIRASVLRDIEPAYLAFVLFTALDGLSLHFIINDDYLDTARLKEYTKQIFLHGILKPKE